MSSDTIAEAVGAATDTEHVMIGRDLLQDPVVELFSRGFQGRSAVVIADDNTFAAAGEVVLRSLRRAGGPVLEPYLFPATPTLHAEDEPIDALVASLREHDAIPVAVGAGTINDVVKRASFLAERPYMSVVTAASVDGYTAFGAAITEGGYKQTMECPAPHAVLADLAVLERAPAPMTSAGYGDLLAKIAAGADWIVADMLEVESIDETAWSLVQGPLREATAQPARLHAGDPDVLERLIEGLIMSGLAMQSASSSRPASGAEHQFSHLWEMEGLGQNSAASEPPLSHGFKVSLGTIASAALYERLLSRDLTALDVQALARAWPSWQQVEREIRAAELPSGADEAAIEQTRSKYVEADELAARLALLTRRWPELADRLREQLSGAAELRDDLAAAGCPTAPADIGLSTSRLRSTYSRARLIRSRYTVLDLAHEAGLLNTCVGELFDAGGFWAEEAG